MLADRDGGLMRGSKRWIDLGRERGLTAFSVRSLLVHLKSKVCMAADHWCGLGRCLSEGRVLGTSTGSEPASSYQLFPHLMMGLSKNERDPFSLANKGHKAM